MIQRFYKVSTDVILDNYGMVNSLMGDQVIGLFVPRFSGVNHAQAAIDTALELLRAFGHEEKHGPWALDGVGVHTGPAYVGTVGHGHGVNEIAVLGNDANLTARLSSAAAQGEVMISQVAMNCAELDRGRMESQKLDLKGINEMISVRVMRVGQER